MRNSELQNAISNNHIISAKCALECRKEKREEIEISQLKKENKNDEER